MTTYSADMVTLLFDIFPEAFSICRESERYNYKPGPFGIEKVSTGKQSITLASLILDNAKAIELKHPGRGYKYIEIYRSAKERRKDINAFNA